MMQTLAETGNGWICFKTQQTFVRLKLQKQEMSFEVQIFVPKF